MNINNPWMKIYVESDDKRFLVRGIFNTPDEVNKFCSENRDAGLICTADGKHIVADLQGQPTLESLL